MTVEMTAKLRRDRRLLHLAARGEERFWKAGWYHPLNKFSRTPR